MDIDQLLWNAYKKHQDMELTPGLMGDYNMSVSPVLSRHPNCNNTSPDNPH